MAALEKESELYRTLSQMYNEKESKDITYAFYNECVETAAKFSRCEIRFVLFKLKLLNEDVDAGNEQVNSVLNSLQKVLDVLTGKNVKKALIIDVLECVLDQM